MPRERVDQSRPKLVTLAHDSAKPERPRDDVMPFGQPIEKFLFGVCPDVNVDRMIAEIHGFPTIDIQQVNVADLLDRPRDGSDEYQSLRGRSAAHVVRERNNPRMGVITRPPMFAGKQIWSRQI